MNIGRFDVAAKLLHHERLYEFVAGRPIVPIGVEISPSAECNESCPGCLYIQKRYSRSGFIDAVKLVKTLREMDVAGVRSVTWSGGGEPTMHPGFRTLTECCGGMEQGLFTNAREKPRYDPARMSWIRVTLNCEHEPPVDNISVLRECRTLGLCINVTHSWKKDLALALTVADRTRADYVQVRPMLGANGAVGGYIGVYSSDPRVVIADYKFNDCRVPREYSRCFGYHFVPFIWEDGSLDVCGYLREHPGYNIGNIYEESFFNLVKRFPHFVKVHDKCQTCCKNHEINKLINDVFDAKDVNFI